MYCIAAVAFCCAFTLLHKLCILSSIVQRDISGLNTDNFSVVDSSVDCEKTHNIELTVLDHSNNNQHENCSELAQVSISISDEEKVSAVK